MKKNKKNHIYVKAVEPVAFQCFSLDQSGGRTKHQTSVGSLEPLKWLNLPTVHQINQQAIFGKVQSFVFTAFVTSLVPQLWIGAPCRLEREKSRTYQPSLSLAFSVSEVCRRSQLKVSTNVRAERVPAAGQEARRAAARESFSPGEPRSLTLINWGLGSNWPALTNIIHQPLIKARLGKCSWGAQVLNRHCFIPFYE